MTGALAMGIVFLLDIRGSVDSADLSQRLVAVVLGGGLAVASRGVAGPVDGAAAAAGRRAAEGRDRLRGNGDPWFRPSDSARGQHPEHRLAASRPGPVGVRATSGSLRAGRRRSGAGSAPTEPPSTPSPARASPSGTRWPQRIRNGSTHASWWPSTTTSTHCAVNPHRRAAVDRRRAPPVRNRSAAARRGRTPGTTGHRAAGAADRDRDHHPLPAGARRQSTLIVRCSISS